MAAANPDCAPELLYHLGSNLLNQDYLEEAVFYLKKATQKKENYFEAWHDLGVAYALLSRHKEALGALRKAAAIQPNSAELFYNVARLHDEFAQYQDSIHWYLKALTISPNFIDALINISEAYRELQQFEQAIEYLDGALAINTSEKFLLGKKLHLKMLICDWQNLNELNQDIKTKLIRGMEVADPFGYQAISESEEDLKRCAILYGGNKFPPKRLVPFTKKDISQIGKKIRIAYLSGEFKNQATSHLLIGVFEHHNHDQFEIIALDNSVDDGSDMRQRINQAFSKIIPIQKLTDQEVVNLIQKLEIDILINLNGYFGKGRQGVFADKPAPIQVNYLGFPGTLGVEYMDYMIADRVVIPEASQPYYSEKIVYLPHAYQANDNSKLISKRKWTREECGLPEEGFVFCCFNNNYKITPKIFDVWMKVLTSVEKSILWLLEDNSAAMKNLIKEAKYRNIDPSRLIFAKRIDLADHLSRHSLADLFLDTLPYNAHTTASDALWAGVPLITCRGATFPGRVAASLLRAIGLPKLITNSLGEYQDLAIELAKDPNKLREIKKNLALNRLDMPLFNTKLFTENIEQAYNLMHERYVQGLAPDHIYIPPIG